jgi:signal transduction histidine kinase
MNVFNLSASFGYPHPPFIALRGYTALLLVMVIAIRIFRSYSMNLVRANSANEILADEVQQVTRKLSRFYVKENALKHEMSVQVERERLMGDLHDGLAGNLISINALAEYGTNEVLDEIRGLSNQALLDLRLVVDSLDSFDGELAVALAAFRERMVPQYSGSGVNIIWDYDYAPMLQDLRPEVNLAMFRILQESICNAVRHGKATQIMVIVRPSKAVGSSASIWVLDNGDASGFFAPGFGMRNMQRRAERIHGKVYFRLRGNGSAVLLKIR